MYGESVYPVSVLIVKCKNGYGIDLCANVDGDMIQSTYIASTIDEALNYARKFLQEEGNNEE